MATAYTPKTNEQIADQQLDAEVDAFLNKMHGTIQDARSKMSAGELVEADRKAKVVLDRATSVAKSSRHSA